MKTRTPGKEGFRFSLPACLIGLAGGLAGAAFSLAGTAAGGSGGGMLGGVLGAAAAAAAAGLLGSKLFFPAPKAEEPQAKPEAPKIAASKPAEKEAEIPPDRTDELTGLANANGIAAWFREKAPRLQANDKQLVILVANLDRFDEVERSRGKATADAVLIEVAQRVKVFAGEDGIAARTTADEFVAIAAASPEHALEFAEERAGTLAETIGRPVELKIGAMWIGGSVGAAAGKPEEGENVLARARMAFAKARRLGLGRYVVDTGGQV